MYGSKYCILCFEDSTAEKSIKTVYALKNEEKKNKNAHDRSGAGLFVSQHQLTLSAPREIIYIQCLYFSIIEYWINVMCVNFFHFKDFDFHSVCNNNYTYKYMHACIKNELRYLVFFEKIYMYSTWLETVRLNTR